MCADFNLLKPFLGINAREVTQIYTKGFRYNMICNSENEGRKEKFKQNEIVK